MKHFKDIIFIAGSYILAISSVTIIQILIYNYHGLILNYWEEVTKNLKIFLLPYVLLLIINYLYSLYIVKMANKKIGGDNNEK